MVARNAPKRLGNLIGFVDLSSDEQKQSVITALNEVNENGCTGWQMVAQYAPESFGNLISLVSDDKKASIIKCVKEKIGSASEESVTCLWELIKDTGTTETELTT